MPVQHTFPMAELKTARLLLRAHREQDIEPTVAMFGDEHSRRCLSPPQPNTHEEGRPWNTDTAHQQPVMGDGIHWAITDAQTGRYLGGIGVKGTDWLRRSTEIGYAMAPWARGRGYAPEALRAAAEWLLREQTLNRVELFASTGNIASQRVAEKAGFVREGVARNSGFTHHGQQDMVTFSLIPADLAS